jgi:hypothetical protein
MRSKNLPTGSDPLRIRVKTPTWYLDHETHHGTVPSLSQCLKNKHFQMKSQAEKYRSCEKNLQMLVIFIIMKEIPDQTRN